MHEVSSDALRHVSNTDWDTSKSEYILVAVILMYGA